MTRIVIARHGRTKWHVEGRYAGTTDVPLDDYGRTQAKRVAETLSDEKIDAVFSSPASRCLELAQIVALEHGLSVEKDERLREINFGDWDGMTFADILKRDGDAVSRWTSNPTSPTVPGGESVTDVYSRTWEWVSEVGSRFPGCCVFVASHGGPIRTIVAGILDLPLSRVFRTNVDLASISVVNYEGEFSNVEKLNDTCHLSGL
ncbi:MAG: histidine phosphatase family protein [Actinomycetota bacterium]|nr:histidine phosphatase family protein [Actinomycetota bacterium]